MNVEFLTIPEAAVALRVGAQWLRRFIARHPKWKERFQPTGPMFVMQSGFLEKLRADVQADRATMKRGRPKKLAAV